MYPSHNQSSETKEKGEKKRVKDIWYSSPNEILLFEILSGRGASGKHRNICTRPNSRELNFINPRELNFRFQGGMFRELGFAWVTLYTILVQHFPLYLDH